MKDKLDVIPNTTPEEEAANDLKRETRASFAECAMHIAYIENHPILHDSTYTEILKEARAAFKQAMRGRRDIARDPYEANPPIVFALMHLKAQREMLDRLLAQDAENPTIAAIRDVAHKVDEHHKENMDAHSATHARLPKPPRADKGGKHEKRTKLSGAWKSAKDVADDFSKGCNRGKGFTPKGGKRKLGTCTENKINKWDSEHPDYEHKNSWGYYAELRIDSNLKSEYFEVLAHWAEYWEKRIQWDKQHPGVKFPTWRRTDIDTARIGKDENGDLVLEPKPDPRRT